MNGKGYNRADTWGDLYEKFDQNISTGRSPADNESFAVMFEERGMKGFKPKEQDLAPANADRQESRYPQVPQDVLDLHGLTVDEAEREITKFILEARERGLVFVRIITGKGVNSVGGSSKLRPLTTRLLNHMISGHLVRDFRSADLQHGGFGALYVYIK